MGTHLTLEDLARTMFHDRWRNRAKPGNYPLWIRGVSPSYDEVRHFTHGPEYHLTYEIFRWCFDTQVVRVSAQQSSMDATITELLCQRDLVIQQLGYPSVPVALWGTDQDGVEMHMGIFGCGSSPELERSWLVKVYMLMGFKPNEEARLEFMVGSERTKCTCCPSGGIRR